MADNQDITLGPTSTPIPTLSSPGNVGTDFDRVAAVQDLFNRNSTRDAIAALEAATQFEGQLGFDSDVRSGIPQEQALAKWAPKMFVRHPTVAAALMQRQKPLGTVIDIPGGRKGVQVGPQHIQLLPEALPTGDIPGRAIKSETGEIIGYDAPGARHVIRPEMMKGGATVRDQIALNNARLRGLEKQMEAAVINRDKAALPILQKKHQTVLDDLEKLASTPIQGKRPKPKIGDIVDGHKFLGGPLNKPESWEPVE